MLDQLVLEDNRLLLGDLVFRMEDGLGDDYKRVDKDYFILYKSRPLVRQYLHFFGSIDLEVRNVFELGLWDGGSTAFWFEMLQPDRHVGVDKSERGDSTYFKRWITSRGLGDKVTTHWGVDQSDQDELRDIAQRQFDGPLDLVIDDASHFYEPTKASFEALFPLLRKGGLYVIEDWQWEHAEEFADPDHPWAREKGLTSLVVELVEATGTLDKGLVESLTVKAGFTAVQRGWATIDEREFELEHYILRRPQRV